METTQSVTKFWREGTHQCRRDRVTLCRYIEYVGSAFASLLPVADIDCRESDGGSFDQATRRVPHDGAGTKQQAAKAMRAKTLDEDCTRMLLCQSLHRR